jgi:hypothetical protein
MGAFPSTLASDSTATVRPTGTSHNDPPEDRGVHPCDRQSAAGRDVAFDLKLG